MKTIFFFLVFSMLICFGGTIGYAQENGNQTPVVIVVSDDESLGQPPRAPLPIPISGYVYENEIYLFFSNDLGDVSIRIEDSLGCTVLSTSVDSSDGSESLPFSGYPDSYTIFFSLGDNTSYIGRFELTP